MLRRLLQPVEIVGKAERPLRQSLLKLDQARLSDPFFPLVLMLGLEHDMCVEGTKACSSAVR